MGAAPMGQHTAQPGNAAQATAIARQLVELAQKALPMAPIGSDLHKAFTDVITKLAKIAPAAEAAPGIDETQLKNLMQSAQQSAPMQAFLRMQGAGAGAGPPASVPGAGGAPAAG